MLCFYIVLYFFFIVCLGDEYMAEIVMQSFRSSTTMLVACKNSLWRNFTDFIMFNVAFYDKSGSVMSSTIEVHCVCIHMYPEIRQ